MPVRDVGRSATLLYRSYQRTSKFPLHAPHPLLYKTTLQRQVLVKQHAADTVAVNHAGVIVYFQLVGKVGAHHYQNIIPVRRVDQAAVIAAGIPLPKPLRK